MRGRKPKPTLLHELHGTLRTTRHKVRGKEPIAEGDLMSEPPEWMTDSQQAGWRYAVENAPRGLLKLIDRATLAIWVEAEDRHRTAAMKQASLDRNSQLPLLTKDRHGQIVPSPYIGIMHKASLILLKAGSELGFSPAARPRLAAASSQYEEPDDESPWARLEVIQGGKKTAI